MHVYRLPLITPTDGRAAAEVLDWKGRSWTGMQVIRIIR